LFWLTHMYTCVTVRVLASITSTYSWWPCCHVKSM